MLSVRKICGKDEGGWERTQAARGGGVFYLEHYSQL